MIKLGMSILVRDEVDIIEDNVRFHAAMGVSEFIVTDNGSTDGTRDILSDLSREFSVTVLDEAQHTIDQDIWVTRMAHGLKESGRVNWVINNDSDEFWVPADGDLPESVHRCLTGKTSDDELMPNTGVIHCPRFNLLPHSDVIGKPDYSYLDNTIRILKNPTDAETANGENVLITDQGTKVMCRLDGLDSIGMGNHDAVHSAGTAHSSTISIAHYPLRSYHQFECKVRNHGSSIKNNTRFGEDINWHLRKWYDALTAGQLEQEYRKYVIAPEKLQDLIDDGVARTDVETGALIRDAVASTHRDCVTLDKAA